MAATPKNKTLDLEAGWIRELADILNETGLTEVEIEKGDIRLRVSRQGGVQTVAPISAPDAHAALAPEAPAPEQPAPQDVADKVGTLKTPIVGTVYLSPSPGTSPFVKIGDKVVEGQTLMIVEAMKTMNPITATTGGTVTSILVSDSQPVEFDDPLLVIE